MATRKYFVSSVDSQNDSGGNQMKWDVPIANNPGKFYTFTYLEKDCVTGRVQELRQQTKDETPIEWASRIVPEFNSWAKDNNQHERDILEITNIQCEEILDDGSHDWFKDELFTSGRWTPYKCSRCGIKGKRDGTSSTIRISSKYRLVENLKCTRQDVKP